MSILKAISGFFRGCAVYVSRAFVSLVGHQAASDFAHGALAILKTSVGQTALRVVEDIAMNSDPNLSPTQKRENAFDRILGDLKNTGVQVSNSEINLLIETAYAAVSGRFGVPKPAPQPLPQQ